jgi:hypothetical protein
MASLAMDNPIQLPVVIGCSDGIKAPSLLSFQASTIAVALAIY